MGNIILILKTLNLLRDHRFGKIVLISLLTLVLGTGTGFSIVLLIPLLQMITDGNITETDRITPFFSQTAEKLGMHLNLETILVIYIVLLSVMAMLQYFKSILDTSYQQTFIYKIRCRLFRKIIMAEWPLLNTKSKTNHLQVLSKEVPNLANYLFYLLRLFTSLITTITYLVWAMLVSVKFTLIITTIGLLLFVVLRKYLFKAFHIGKEFVNAYTHLLKYIDDFWQTVKMAKVHSSEEFYYNKFEKASTSLLDLEFRIQKNYALPKLIYRISGIFVLTFVIYIGFRLGEMPLTSFFILIILFARIYPQFTDINTDVSMLITNLPSVNLVMQLDRDFPDCDFSSNKNQNLLPLQKEIKIVNLSFAFPGGQKLFQNFNYTIPALKLTGIIGESGKGKTTLIDLIAGLQIPSIGEIIIDDKKLNEINRHSWKTSIGYLPQDAFFIDGTLRENLVWDSTIEIKDSEIIQVMKQVNAAHLINRFENGLSENIVNYQFHFSGGELQRLALARVLLRHPSLLLLDEATSSLDPENEKQIMELLDDLKNTVTILFVTHRTSVLPWFDKLIEISEPKN